MVNPASLTDADVIAAWQTAGQTCVQVFFVRGGRNNGNRAFFPLHSKAEEIPAVLSAFIAQFYDDKPPPPLLLVNQELPEQELIAEALTLKGSRKVDITVPQRGEALGHSPRGNQRTRSAGAETGRIPPARPSCWKAWRSCSICPLSPSGSRYMTTRTSWARTHTAR